LLGHACSYAEKIANFAANLTGFSHSLKHFGTRITSPIDPEKDFGEVGRASLDNASRSWGPGMPSNAAATYCGALPRDVQDRSLVARIFWAPSKRLELAIDLNYSVFRSGETEERR